MMRVVIHNYTGDGRSKTNFEQYRAGGEWGVWCDGLYDHITLEIADKIRAAGFAVRRRGNTVWVRNEDMPSIIAKGIRSC